MSLERPLALLLLLALPLAAWLHRRLRVPRERLVSSVEPLRDARAAQAAARPQRLVDAELACLLLGLTALSIAAAGPLLGRARPTLFAVQDRSPSTSATRDGVTLRALALRGFAAAVAELPDVVVEVVDLDDPGGRVRRSVASELVGPGAADGMAPQADGLPGSLFAAVARARAAGFPAVLLIGDRGGDLPGVVVSGPGVGPDADAGVLGAVLDGNDAVVQVLRRPDVAVQLVVTTDAVAPRVIAVGPGRGVVEVRAPAPAPGAVARYEIRPGGSLAADDVLTVVRRGGARRVRVVGDGSEDELAVRRLLDVLGIRTTDSRLEAADAQIVVGRAVAPPDPGAPPVLHLAALPGATPALRVVPAEAAVVGARVVTGGVLAAATPGPEVRLGCTGRIEIGPDLPVVGSWRTVDGLVAVAREREVVTTLRPGAEFADWRGDASFPVFVVAALDHLVGGADRLEITAGLPAGEASWEAEPPRPLTSDEIRALVRPPAADPDTSALGGLPAAVGALALGVATVLGVRSGDGA